MDAFDALLYRTRLAQQKYNDYYDHHVVTYLVWRFFKR